MAVMHAKTGCRPICSACRAPGTGNFFLKRTKNR
uniref:Uncharacterized protein n=1 Tax=Arundo donax TaxID=35708 RepID=A0A0A9H8Z7_ARUDO